MTILAIRHSIPTASCGASLLGPAQYVNSELMFTERIMRGLARTPRDHVPIVAQL
jgi:hypothetical protein